jgi:polyphosphate kinase 2 (PPK2 family)
MFEQVILDLKVHKREYKQAVSQLQARLYDMEQTLVELRQPVVIIFEGWAGTSKIQTISTLTRRLDPRGLRVHPITPPRTYETQYPWLYRFWLKLPSYGQLAIFDRSWYRQMLNERTQGGLEAADWLRRCDDVVGLERMLVDDGAVVFKFWLHISRKEQQHRFHTLMADKLTAWQVTDDDRWQNRHYDEVAIAVEDMLARTDTAVAPWRIVPATDKHYARLAVLKTVLATLEARLGRTAVAMELNAQDDSFDDSGASFRRAGPLQAEGNGAHASLLDSLVQERAAVHPLPHVAGSVPGVLERVDLGLKFDEKTYSKQLKQLQAMALLLGLQVYRQQRPVVLVFEGWDAAGKGGAIQRVTAKLDPRSYVVHAIAAPTADEKAHHYLYRFWARLPPRGQIAIFDRSWYGRVLVERVEGFARADEWQRAYAEINDFERQLIEFGAIVCKFWMHISPEEQLRRFEQRQNVRYKAWKLTDEDWRNRDKWPQYEAATNEMLLRTSTPAAPWTIVEAEDKRYARVKVLGTFVQRLESELGEVEL